MHLTAKEVLTKKERKANENSARFFFNLRFFLFLLRLGKSDLLVITKLFEHKKEFKKFHFFQLSSSVIANSFTENEALKNVNLIKINVFSLAELFLTSYAFFYTKFFTIHLVYSARFPKVHST